MALDQRVRIALQYAATLVILATVLLTAAWRIHKSRTVQIFGDLVTSVATEDRVVALTFDDGPTATYTDSILDLLQAHHVTATFFVVGAAVERHPELARKILEHGHELGNHSYSHNRMVLRPRSEIRFEVDSTDALLRRAGATGRIHFRPPYGKRLVGLPWYLSRTDRVTVLWSLEPDSWYRTADEMTQHVIDNICPGSIILLHVELPSRVEERAALPRIIDGLRARGFGFVTVSQLMARGTH